MMVYNSLLQTVICYTAARIKSVSISVRFYKMFKNFWQSCSMLWFSHCSFVVIACNSINLPRLSPNMAGNGKKKKTYHILQCNSSQNWRSLWNIVCKKRSVVCYLPVSGFFAYFERLPWWNGKVATQEELTTQHTTQPTAGTLPVTALSKLNYWIQS